MARVKAVAVGYYKHRRVKAGEIITMKEVDEKGFYVDGKGKRKLYPKRDFKGEKTGESEERKCKWVDHVSTDLDKPLDPKEVAAVISGKNPGQSEELEEEPEDEKPAKGK